MIPTDTFKRAAGTWGIRLKAVRPDIDLHGSPERTLCRTVIEDDSGAFFVLEGAHPVQRERKRFIGQVLGLLHADGLKQVSPYLKTPTGDLLAYCDEIWWQMAAYIAGTPLNRPAYITDGEKGEALARFLAQLYRHTPCLSRARVMYPFSLKRYILKLESAMQQHDPDVRKRFAPMFDFLHRSFLEVHETLSVRFCHGDFHPLNIIWRDHAVAVVIDWEFCGLKSEIYDVANLVGCIGMENPSGLTDNLVMSFIAEMRQISAVSDRSWGLLAEFVVALRFAWLAEWLRKKDKEMIDLEETYMNLLLENLEHLKTVWGLPRF